MPEEAFPATLAIPGTFIRVQSEGLITAGAVSTGNVGIVGTATTVVDTTHILNDLPSAEEAFGARDDTHQILRGIELLLRSGARTIFARGLAAAATNGDYQAAFDELLKDDVNLLVAPELPTDRALAVLGAALNAADKAQRDVIAVVGSDQAQVVRELDEDGLELRPGILGQVPDDGRIVFVAPGLSVFGEEDRRESLSGTFTAAAVAGLLSSLAPQTSPTNKVIAGLPGLATRFSYAENVQLVSGRVLALEERNGVRVIRGLSSDSGAFAQITTRRITNFAKAGIRSASDPFLGKLNNVRVRGALRGAIAGFLDSMVEAEMLIGYTLKVTAERDDEINSRAIVNAVLQPTFSIDFILVTLVLE